MPTAAYSVILERVAAESSCPTDRAERVARTLATYAEHAELSADEVNQLLQRMNLQQLAEYFYKEVMRR